ncbi:class I SAM-dependent methyltransferase [Erwinia phyllosphaerae]|uniref:class I SAM-dependent methyltransferase n=1 Tax=Erwinia phyllosphaerae TaxID=2853256 RepID=UPI001FEDED10|nr:class I SAM-dependent methyltransferase [Erwinia phyllosphaerae]MBV4366050.1 methyltransferase domain-containing protein [Erwinia phyllosphaerae]
MLIDRIDFAALYQQQLQQAKRTEKSPQHWDKRAQKMSDAPASSQYLQQLVARIDLSDAATLLDVGCGPGTVCLALADRLEQVHGLDYSKGMLDVAGQRAASLGINNALWHHRAWEESWDDIPVCDIAVASRSTLVGDLRQALEKLNKQARLRVYTTHTVSGTFLDPLLLRAIGRPVDELPNYIYAVNTLYQMGIHARVDFIRDAAPPEKSIEQTIQAVERASGKLDENERRCLIDYYRQQEPPTGKEWALVSWECRPAR